MTLLFYFNKCIQIHVQNGANFDVFFACLATPRIISKNSPSHHKLAKSVTGHALRVQRTFTLEGKRPKIIIKRKREGLLSLRCPYVTVLGNERVYILRTSRAIRVRRRPWALLSVLPLYPVQDRREDLKPRNMGVAFNIM